MLTPQTSPHDLARLLGTTLRKLTYVLYALEVDNQYSCFTIAKKNGGVRIIRAPKEQLKRLQRRLKVHLERLYDPHQSATGFIKNRGIVANAQKHTKKFAVFNLDLMNFFDQINFGRVRGMLIAKPYALRADTATLIAQLCCCNKVIPQGAPTSPVISNMICKKMDRELSFLAKNCGAFYTRYADDITFSFRKIEDNQIFDQRNGIETGEILEKLIHSNGFSINKEKVRLQTSSERQVVTGLKVNKKVNLDRRYIRTTRAMLFSLSLDIEEANRIFKEKHPDGACRMELMVAGRVNFIGMVKGIDSSVYQSLAQKFNNLPLEYKLPIKPSTKKSELENRLHFYGYENRARLNHCVWVVSFEGIEGITEEYEYIQGTAFMVKGQRVLTASHIFSKAGDPEFCFIHRIFEPTKKYKMKIDSRCKTSDILSLAFVDEELPKFDSLKVAESIDINSGYKLSIVGFPQLLPGHSSVTIIPCTVTNAFVRNTFKNYQVTAVIQSGNSGGPVVNAYMEVVGMATNGLSATLDEDTLEIDLAGFNSFVSAEHF